MGGIRYKNFQNFEFYAMDYKPTSNVKIGNWWG